MIIDLPRFIEVERPFWRELEEVLGKLEADAGAPLDLATAKRLHYLYQRASADLSRMGSLAAEPQLRAYLESLVARAYGEVHETRALAVSVALWRWFWVTFPQTFRRHVAAFWLALAVTMGGALFGGLALTLDPTAKEVLMPFPQLQVDPAQRVRQEEERGRTHDPLGGAKTHFSSYLMTHNTRIAIFTLALGMTWAVGTLVLLFYNGVLLGAVVFDYLLAGQTKFLLGWLLPHGVIEIPAILVAGQAGLLLGGALLGRADRAPLDQRLRRIGPDLVTLIGGTAVLLVWAGFVEAFLSQYHEPVVPYELKIAFGIIELGLLSLFLARAGRTALGQVEDPAGNAP